MTLYGSFLNSTHRRSHKWYHYFPVYEQHLERFRNRHITLFEIGLGEGGSLQQWRRYFGPFARIVGIDIEPMCRQLEEDQIKVRIGSQDNVEFLDGVVEEFGQPDIVIDDGSHIQQHVNTTFDFLYPKVNKNGVYLVEDLHAAYWPNHGAGLRHPESFIERAKNYVDDMHAEYTGGELPRTALGDRTTSIHFYDSIIVFEIGEYRTKGHKLTGNAKLFRLDFDPNRPPEEPSEPADEAADEDARQQGMEKRLQHMETERQTLLHHLDELRGYITKLEKVTDDHRAKHDEAARRADELQSLTKRLNEQIETISNSTSWRITAPMRGVGRLVKRV